LRVFLDANVLFSAALGGESFRLLWGLAEAGRIDLCTSPYCLAEAETNLVRKEPEALASFRRAVGKVQVVPDATTIPGQVARALPEDDAPVLAAAVAARVDVLVTGDVRHFGALMRRARARPRIRTVRAFLLEGPGVG
jgi:predicted nucleic acid-binding protein